MEIRNEMWFKLLSEGSSEVNLERVDNLAGIDGLETLKYVLRTLEYEGLEAVNDGCRASVGGVEKDSKSILDRAVVTALQWSEVAKCGSPERREEWKAAGINLSIHNIGSAEIYRRYAEKDKKCDREDDGKTSNNAEVEEIVINITADLIRIHGTIGQYIRGEISNRDIEEVYFVYEKLIEGTYGIAFKEEEVFDAFRKLTGAVISGVSKELWENVREEVCAIIEYIPDIPVECGFSTETRLLSVDDRLRRIKTDFCKKAPVEIGKYSFWFPAVALESFSDDDFLGILRLSMEEAEKYEDVRDINFKRISDFLYYDYKGKKHINIYKKRIVESFLKTGASKHVDMDFTVEDQVLFVDFRLSKTCEKLVEFCDEAELSGDINYAQAIVMLFDFFEFRHDTFDRLNNEESYLSTMDNISGSRKGELINHAVGDTIVDVGSGSGVLLNILEERYPNRTIIGTDISSAVIEALKKKKAAEKRHWDVKVHNFVDSDFEPCTTVIFSSILHEIYSYTEGENGRFDIESVKMALRNAYKSLAKGGRILIRDGAKTPSKEKIKVLLKTKEAADFFENYRRDFKGLTDYDRNDIVVEETNEGRVVSADINFIREFIYTLTWGPDSYFNEVKEQFGYMTIAEFRAFFEELGAKILVAESYFEADYKTHLDPMIRLMDMNGNEISYPDSNCFVIAEKL